MNIIIKALIIALCLVTGAQANSKLYQSNGDLPFVEMMLAMMTAMGMIDEVPEYLINHGGYYNNSALPGSYAYQPGVNAPLLHQGQYPESALYPQQINKLTRQCTDGNCERNKRSGLDGVWMTQYGEMIGIKEHQFLWSDGKSRYLTGEIKKSKSDFSLKVSQSGHIVNYQYIVEGNRMQTRDINGIVRSFVKVPYKR